MKSITAAEADAIRRLPKTDLHVHLDGSLRLSTLIDLARRAQGRAALARPRRACASSCSATRYRNLSEYLEGFRYTVAVLQDAEALERAAFELCEDCQDEGVRYLEIRFAPQLHVHAGFEMRRRGARGGPRHPARRERVQRAARGRVGRRAAVRWPG